jgi:hypothetical protein
VRPSSARRPQARGLQGSDEARRRGFGKPTATAFFLAQASMTMRTTALLLLAALLLSGCSDQGAQEPAEAVAAPTTGTVPAVAANGTAQPELPVNLELADCLQLHTAFPYPIAVFTQLGFQLPPGFALDSPNGQTVDVVITWWFCGAGRLNNTLNGPFEAPNSMVIGMPVVPPADLAGRDPLAGEVRLDLMPLTWVLSERLASDHLGKMDGLRGGYVEYGPVSQTVHVNVGVGESYGGTAPASFGTFDVDAVVQAAPGPAAATRDRMWLWPGGGEVASYLDLTATEGAVVGSGTADLRFAGDADAGAPPATAGFATVSQGIGVSATQVQLTD